MDFLVTLERVSPIAGNDDELLIQELEKKAEFEAHQKNERVPSLTEVLYHMSEEEMLDIKDLVNDAINQ